MAACGGFSRGGPLGGKYVTRLAFNGAISAWMYPAALRPFVTSLWASEGTAEPVPGAREHILPTGRMHLVVRLSPEPIAIWEAGARVVLGHAVVGGARSVFYVKDVSAPSEAVVTDQLAEVSSGATRLRKKGLSSTSRARRAALSMVSNQLAKAWVRK